MTFSESTAQSVYYHLVCCCYICRILGSHGNAEIQILQEVVTRKEPWAIFGHGCHGNTEMHVYQVSPLSIVLFYKFEK